MSRNGVAKEGHRPSVGVGKTQQHPDESGLAGTVGPKVTERATTGNEELHLVDGDVLPESLG
jgi:hypothetical protein